MSFSTVYRSTRQFYFNYHHVESSSLYFHSAFTRRCQFALRLVMTFLIGAFLAYRTPLRDHVTQVYMIPNLGILCIQETFGCTLSNVVQVILVIVPLSIFLFVMQLIGLSHQNYLAGELLFLFSSFCISYKCQKLQSRKSSLWFNCIFFATIINEESVRMTFVLELLAVFFLGMAIALLVSACIFPLFATCDIENRVNYCFLHLEQMQTFVLQAFLSKDQTEAGIYLARATIVERRLRDTINQLRGRLLEAQFEPSRCLQWLYNRKRKNIFSCTVERKEDLITTLMFHVCSLQSMVQQCPFNDYHNDLSEALKSKFDQLMTSQSIVVSSMIDPSSITREILLSHFIDLETALDSLNSGYKNVRLHLIEEVLRTGTKTQSEDHLSHTFFFFQLGAIIRQLKQSTVIDSPDENSPNIKQRKAWKDVFKCQPNWSRILSALKSMFILGVGSVFVMVPSLANTLANGQWILTGLCMTQGDTVGGAFTTMRMRFVGTLLGSMWAYTMYLAVGEDSTKIFAMLVPWLLLFGYLKLIPQWDYTATVAASTPIVVNLGQLYGDVYRQGNYVLLRIQETTIGIGLGAILTILIFPIFAVDLLKVNIQDTLQTCRRAAESIHSVYDGFFQHQHSTPMSITANQQQGIKFSLDLQRGYFNQLISSQRTLVNSASQEPSVWWFNYGFSSERYNTLVQQEHDMFRMLYNMHTTLMHINECATKDDRRMEDLRLNAAGGRFLPDLHRELADLSRQLSECVDLWTSYMTLTQTTYYRWSRLHVPYRKKKLIKGDLSANQQSLIELHRTLLRLQTEHQQATNRLLDYYIEKSGQGDELSSFVPYVNSDHAEVIFVAISAMYYSTIQLVQVALALGTTIHTIFELETTSVYRYY